MRHRFAWRRSREGNRPPKTFQPRGTPAYRPLTALAKRRSLGRCVHCLTLTRWDAVGPEGGLVQVYQTAGGDEWLDDKPECREAQA